jgi:hypothetical protein
MNNKRKMKKKKKAEWIKLKYLIVRKRDIKKKD